MIQVCHTKVGINQRSIEWCVPKQVTDAACGGTFRMMDLVSGLVSVAFGIVGMTVRPLDMISVRPRRSCLSVRTHMP